MRAIEKFTSRASWGKKNRRAFLIYAAIVIAVAMLFAPAIACAADDPIAVVNNLPNFIFGIIRAIGFILLGFGVV